MWYTKRRRAQNPNDFETWIVGGVSPTLNAFDNTGDSRATVVIAFSAGNSAKARSIAITEDATPPLRASASGTNQVPTVLILDGTRVDDIRVYDDEITPCLKNRMGTGGNNVPFVATDIESKDNPKHHLAIPIQDGRAMQKNQNGLGIGESGAPSYTLDQTGGQSVAVFPIQGTIIGRQDHNGPQGKGYGNETDPMYTLDSISQHGVATEMQVRRLTPIECERLMGWPDNHTLHRADGKKNSDTTRYKMCGNGVASPVAQWIAEQINNAEQL